MNPFSHLTDWTIFEIENTGSESETCDCCGGQTLHNWGFVHSGDSTISSYFIRWTTGKPDHGAWFDLITGHWGSGSEPSQRSHVALEFRIANGSPNFMVRNSADSQKNYDSIAQKNYKRVDIIGTELAQHIFAITDAIYMSDTSQEIRNWSDY